MSKDKPLQAASPVDMEARLTHRHHLPLRAWLRMLSTTTRIENEIRIRLRNQFDMTLPRFDLLAQLERHPDGLRMGELSKRMMVTSGNVTGIADQLEREGLVTRVVDPEDRRSFSLRLTKAGLATFKKMAQVHEQWVDDLLNGLDAGQQQQLIQLLSIVKARLP